MFLQQINNWTIPQKLNERGIKWTICILPLKTKKTCNFNHFRRKCISSHEVAEYHQCRALYIIITEFFCTLKRDDMQKRAIFSLFLMICTQTSCVMICHYSVMDKKSRIKKIFYPFNRWIWTRITPKGVYIINAKHCISSRRSLVYHHCESNTTYGWWYTP